MINPAKSHNACQGIEQSEMPQSFAPPARAHHTGENTTKRAGLRGWFSVQEDALVLLARILCVLFCCAFWYGAYRLVKMFLL